MLQFRRITLSGKFVAAVPGLWLVMGHTVFYHLFTPFVRTKDLKVLYIHTLVALVFAAALLTLGIESTGIASAFSDPYSRLRAQDESSYANSVIDLAQNGGWLTPRVLGRYLLYKPPMLLWLSGLSVKLLGLSLWSLRLPSLAAAVLSTVVVFWWTLTRVSVWAAWAAIILLLANPLWRTFSHLCYTDMLWVGFTVISIFCVQSDPTLSTRHSFWGFVASTAGGVMTKNVGGLLPVIVSQSSSPVYLTVVYILTPNRVASLCATLTR